MKKNIFKKILFISIIIGLFSFWSVSAQEQLPPPESIETPPTEEILQPEIIVEANADLPLTEIIPTEETLSTPTVAITINNGSDQISLGEVSIGAEGFKTISDMNGKTKDINARSVLAILYAQDQVDDSFEISELIYYPSFGAFYLRCITVNTEKCDGWLYKINGESPTAGMDDEILYGGESIEIYFSSFIIDDSTLSNSDPETVTENNDSKSSSSHGGSRKETSVSSSVSIESVASDTTPMVLGVETTALSPIVTSSSPIKTEPKATEDVFETVDSEVIPETYSTPVVTKPNKAFPSLPFIFVVVILVGLTTYLFRKNYKKG